MKRLRKKAKKSVKAKQEKTGKIKDKVEEIVKQSGVYKTAEFQAYVIWRSLPAMLRGGSAKTLKKFGIDDDLSMSMLEIETQTEFAKRFKIKIDTCTEWNRIISDKNLINESIHRWAKMITPNVIMALGKTAMRTGKAPEVIAWQKLVEGWEEKSKMGIDASPELLKILDKMDKLLP